MANKLPHANDWKARNIDDWNTKTYHSYMQDKHREMFGCEYAPFRGWRVEQGILGTLIGTRAKEGTHDKAIIKRFIDEAFSEYKPTEDWPGTNFGFIYSYRRNLLQRIEAEASEKERLRERMESVNDVNYTDLSEWL